MQCFLMKTTLSVMSYVCLNINDWLSTKPICCEGALWKSKGESVDSHGFLTTFWFFAVAMEWDGGMGTRKNYVCMFAHSLKYFHL